LAPSPLNMKTKNLLTANILKKSIPDDSQEILRLLSGNTPRDLETLIEAT
jgi:hypothetical protein